MEFVVEPWHWFVLGILLILSELILPAFAALWFGIAAVMVCILPYFPNDGLYHPSGDLGNFIYFMHDTLVQVYQTTLD